MKEAMDTETFHTRDTRDVLEKRSRKALETGDSDHEERELGETCFDDEREGQEHGAYGCGSGEWENGKQETERISEAGTKGNMERRCSTSEGGAFGESVDRRHRLPEFGMVDSEIEQH